MSRVAAMEPQERSLTEPEVNALLEALDDEYEAVATYQQVIADFGPIGGHGRRRRRRGNGEL